MKKAMIFTAAISTAATLILLFLFFETGRHRLLSAVITCGTVSYHLVIRLIIGYVIDGLFHNEMDYTKRWFSPRPWEASFYRKLQVRKWKEKMPTFAPKNFSLQDNSFSALAKASCQAEIVHEVIIPFSFLPLLASFCFGSFGVFLITSMLAAMIDILFVIMQRFNRPRFVRMAER